VLVEHGTPGWLDPVVLSGFSEAYHGPWLSLYRIPGEIEPNAYRGAPRTPVLIADVAALVLGTLSLLWLVLPAGRLSRLARRVPEE
jgi:hypothetical protein